VGVQGEAAAKVKLPCDQGDQIGRYFAHWAFVYFGQFFKNCISSPNLLLLFLPEKVIRLFKAPNGLGYILGDFLKRRIRSP
jgi:hypothetical protein